MKRLLQCILAIGLLVFQLGASGIEVAPATPVQRPIPYKAEAVSGEEQGGLAATVLLLLLLAMGGGLYVVKKRMPKLVGIVGRGGRLRLVESIRLGSHSRVYLLELDQRQLLIAQSGDNLLQLNSAWAQAVPAATATEGEHV